MSESDRRAGRVTLALLALALGVTVAAHTADEPQPPAPYATSDSG